MVTQTFLPSTLSASNSEIVDCKFLFSREQHVFCHIHLPGTLEKIPAIVHDGLYYSIFRAVDSAQSVLELAVKLGHKGNHLAITQAGQKYILWVHEPDAMPISDSAALRDKRLTFKLASCLLLPEGQPYQFTYLAVPDLIHRVPGFQHAQQLYSLLHREKTATQAIEAAADLSRRGLVLALVPLPTSYAICVSEPNASLAKKSQSD